MVTCGSKANEEVAEPAPRSLVAETVTVPDPAGTVTVAWVAVADTTVATVPPKENDACSSPRPVTATSEPE